MIGCLWTRVRKQPIIALYIESVNVLKFYNLEARAFIALLFVIGVSQLAESTKVILQLKFWNAKIQQFEKWLINPT